MTTKTARATNRQASAAPAPRGPAQPIEAASVPGSMLRIGTVIAVTGLSKVTIYRLIGRGEFPKSVALSPRCVAWRQADLAVWLNARGAS